MIWLTCWGCSCFFLPLLTGWDDCEPEPDFVWCSTMISGGLEDIGGLTPVKLRRPLTPSSSESTKWGMSGVLTTLVGSVSSIIRLLVLFGVGRLAGIAIGDNSSGGEILQLCRWTDMSVDEGNLPQQTTHTKMYFFSVKKPLSVCSTHTRTKYPLQFSARCSSKRCDCRRWKNTVTQVW